MQTLRLMYYITIRNWAVYKKDFIANISPTLADPALVLISLGLGLGAFVTNVEGMSYMKFLAPGLTVATALFTSFFESSYGFYVRMTYENVYEAMLTTPIGYLEIVMGELIWVGLKGIVMAFGVGVVLTLFGLIQNIWLLPLITVVGFLVAIPCGAMGLLASAFVHNINQFQTVYSFIIAPLYFMSGIFFPIAQMNGVVKCMAEFFPLIHGVRMAQAIFWNREIISTLSIHGGILLLQSALLSYWAARMIKKKLIQ